MLVLLFEDGLLEPQFNLEPQIKRNNFECGLHDELETLLQRAERIAREANRGDIEGWGSLS